MNPKLIKPVVFSLLAVIVIVVLIIVVKKFLVPNDGDQTSDDARKALDEENTNYTDTVFSSFAERLKVAMVGYGTDEDTIFDVLSYLKTKDDWYKLVYVFGDQEYEGVKKSLVGWLQSELSYSEMDTVKKLLQNIKVTI